MTRRALPLLLVFVASVLALSARRRERSASTTPASTGGGGGGGGSTVEISADPSGALEIRTDRRVRHRGSITIVHQHVLARDDARSRETERAAGPTRSRTRPRAR